MEKLVDVSIKSVVIVATLFSAYLFFVWFPVSIYAEAKCLEAGFPKSKVSVGLERYCVNLDGAVTAIVVKQ